MKALIAIVALVFASSGALAADEKKEPSAAQKAQQEKMTFCNAEAKTRALSGDERKQFMSNCLKKAPAVATPEAVPAAAAPCQDESAGQDDGLQRQGWQQGAQG
jgi:hypothetical protein